MSKNPRSQGVEPSPTPMVGPEGDSRSVISSPFRISDRADISAVIQPAVPPPTMAMRRTATGAVKSAFSRETAEE